MISLFSFLLCIAVILTGYKVRQATSTATRDFLNTLNLTNCDSFPKRLLCKQVPYRTFDGTCNNLCNISLGASFQPLQRLESLKNPTDYAPGFEPRRSVTGKDLPNSRRIARGVFLSGNANIGGPPQFTHITMSWGQFLDHDITLTEAEEAECGNNIAPCPERPGCIGIPILPGDELGINNTFRCIPLRRSFRDRNGDQVSRVICYYRVEIYFFKRITLF